MKLPNALQHLSVLPEVRLGQIMHVVNVHDELNVTIPHLIVSWIAIIPCPECKDHPIGHHCLHSHMETMN